MTIIDITSVSPTSTPDVDILSRTQYRVYDGLLAAGLCLCFLIGLPGNCLSLTYFIRSKKRNLPTLLYITACCIDIVSCVINLPVTVNLMNQRKPGLLGDEICCMIWYFIFVSAQLMSMFVVMMLSVTRAIVILFPFYRIKKAAVFVSISLAFLHVFFLNAIFIFDGDYQYSRALTFCDFVSKPNLIQDLYGTSYSLWTGLTPLIVFLAMLVAICKLKSQNQLGTAPNNRHDASITIICFAVLFLCCNSLTFLNIMLITYSKISGQGYLDFYNNTFMFFYSWQLSEIFCTVLNASINPILYIFRFKDMRGFPVLFPEMDGSHEEILS